MQEDLWRPNISDSTEAETFETVLGPMSEKFAPIPPPDNREDRALPHNGGSKLNFLTGKDLRAPKQGDVSSTNTFDADLLDPPTANLSRAIRSRTGVQVGLNRTETQPDASLDSVRDPELYRGNNLKVRFTPHIPPTRRGVAPMRTSGRERMGAVPRQPLAGKTEEGSSVGAYQSGLVRATAKGVANVARRVGSAVAHLSSDTPMRPVDGGGGRGAHVSADGAVRQRSHCPVRHGAMAVTARPDGAKLPVSYVRSHMTTNVVGNADSASVPHVQRHSLLNAAPAAPSVPVVGDSDGMALRVDDKNLTFAEAAAMSARLVLGSTDSQTAGRLFARDAPSRNERPYDAALVPPLRHTAIRGSVGRVTHDAPMAASQGDRARDAGTDSTRLSRRGNAEHEARVALPATHTRSWRDEAVFWARQGTRTNAQSRGGSVPSERRLRAASLTATRAVAPRLSHLAAFARALDGSLRFATSTPTIVARTGGVEGAFGGVVPSTTTRALHDDALHTSLPLPRLGPSVKSATGGVECLRSVAPLEPPVREGGAQVARPPLGIYESQRQALR